MRVTEVSYHTQDEPTAEDEGSRSLYEAARRTLPSIVPPLDIWRCQDGLTRWAIQLPTGTHLHFDLQGLEGSVMNPGHLIKVSVAWRKNTCVIDQTRVRFANESNSFATTVEIIARLDNWGIERGARRIAIRIETGETVGPREFLELAVDDRDAFRQLPLHVRTAVREKLRDSVFMEGVISMAVG